jgi:hypothetical protein
MATIVGDMGNEFYLSFNRLSGYGVHCVRYSVRIYFSFSLCLQRLLIPFSTGFHIIVDIPLLRWARTFC